MIKKKEVKIIFELTEKEKKVLLILKEQGASFREVSEVYFYDGLQDSLDRFIKAGLVKKHPESTGNLGYSYTLTSFGCELSITSIVEM